MSKRKASDLLARFNSTMDAPARPADDELTEAASSATAPEPRSAPERVPEQALPAAEGEPQPQRARRTPRRRNGQPTHPAITNRMEERPETMPNELVRNLGVRARESLDNRVLDLVHQLRLTGVRSSKAEIVEMLLWELPAKADEDFRKRLAEFKRHAPREVPL